MTAGVQAKWARWAQQSHPGLFGRTIAFSVIAGMAARDQVFPCGFPGAGSRDYMIEGHFARRERFVAVLAGVAIAHQYVLA